MLTLPFEVFTVSGNADRGASGVDDDDGALSEPHAAASTMRETAHATQALSKDKTSSLLGG
jgi:hypothetical protein